MFCKNKKKKKAKKKKANKKVKFPDERTANVSHRPRTFTTNEWLLRNGDSGLKKRYNLLRRYEREVERQIKFFRAQPDGRYKKAAMERLEHYRTTFPDSKGTITDFVKDAPGKMQSGLSVANDKLVVELVRDALHSESSSSSYSSYSSSEYSSGSSSSRGTV